MSPLEAGVLLRLPIMVQKIADPYRYAGLLMTLACVSRVADLYLDGFCTNDERKKEGARPGCLA